MTLDHAIAYFTDEKNIMSCLSVTCGMAAVEYHAMRGAADETGVPIDERSLFDLASLTKLFTGLAVMRLREEGILDLTRPVTAYAPQFVHLTGITVDQVLGFEIALHTPERIDVQPDCAAGLRQLDAIKPGPVVGRAYSDMHSMVLRYVLEGAADQSFEEILQQRLLVPLGMNDTFALVPPERVADCISYDREHRIEGPRWIIREKRAEGDSPRSQGAAAPSQWAVRPRGTIFYPGRHDQTVPGHPAGRYHQQGKPCVHGPQPRRTPPARWILGTVPGLPVQCEASQPVPVGNPAVYE